MIYMKKSLTDEELAEFEQKEIVFNSKEEGDVTMTVKEAVRWGLLLDALEFIGQEFEERGLNLDEYIFIDKVRPKKAILKYIEDRYVAAVTDFKIEESLN